MSFYFNADEIFQVGAQIEQNGEAFYRAAERAATDPAVKSLCGELARWESGHVRLFEAMRRKLPEQAREGGAFDPSSELAGYVKSAADEHVFLKNQEVSALVSQCTTAADVLDLAVRFERDSVKFYTATKNLVAAHLGQTDLDRLIDEENRHIEMLTETKQKLRS